jgi:hypothetical protein
LEKATFLGMTIEETAVKDLIRESGEYLENFNAAVDQLQKAQAEFRAEHPRFGTRYS